MSILSKVKDNTFIITFCTLFFGGHYGWHLLQQRAEINHGKPPAELPATIFVKYLYKKFNTLMEGDTNVPAQGAAAVAPAASKQ